MDFYVLDLFCALTEHSC